MNGRSKEGGPPATPTSASCVVHRILATTMSTQDDSQGAVAFNPLDHSHRRWNPLKREWILCSRTLVSLSSGPGQGGGEPSGG